MALQRSKSAPQGVPALLPPPQNSLVRAASFHTIEEAVKDVKLAAVGEGDEDEDKREDAFNLSGFFPGENKWGVGWGRQEEEKGMMEGSLFGASDEMTREAIKGEDKLGVLSLGEDIKWTVQLLQKLRVKREH